jgi:integrase
LPNLDVTFREQSQRWLDDLAIRKRKPVSPATLHAFGSYVRRLNPMIGEMKLADINNGALKQLVQQLDDEKLSAKTINELVAVVKQVVGSVVDQDGNKVYRREWNHNFMDLPVVSNQNQPCVTYRDVERCIKDAASDQERVLYCVLAGSGLRIAEALAIHVGGQEHRTSWSPERVVIDVHSSIFNGREIGRLKTLAATRTVDLDSRLSDLIAKFVEISGIQPGDYLFQSRSGRPMHLKTARQRLAKHNVRGFHSFRRYRITRLRELGVPEDILRFWVGHEGHGITDRYSKLGENVELRKQWANQAGLGFELPVLSPAPHAESPRISLRGQILEAVLTPEVAPYQASDEDLPAELFETVEVK